MPLAKLWEHFCIATAARDDAVAMEMAWAIARQPARSIGDLAIKARLLRQLEVADTCAPATISGLLIASLADDADAISTESLSAA